ncbi:MAG: hypothetical protein ACRELF_09180, partial [Gemmataceae bacterium]
MVNDLAVLMGELLVGIFIVTPLGTFILYGSCALLNLLTGVSRKPEADLIRPPNPELGPDDKWEDYERSVTSPGVPKPSFEQAMLIIFFATLVNTMGSFIVLRVARLIGQASVRGTFATLTIFFVSSPLGVLVLGGICDAMLPTTFVKGVLVSVLFHFFSILLAAILLAAVYLIAPA